MNVYHLIMNALFETCISYGVRAFPFVILATELFDIAIRFGVLE